MNIAVAAVNAPGDEVPEIVIGGSRYLSPLDRRKYGYVRDYVARLCREFKVRGRRLGKLWQGIVCCVRPRPGSRPTLSPTPS
jgi:hypothetical protein